MKSLSSERREEEIKRFKNLVMEAALKLMKEEQNWSNVSVNKIGKEIRYTPANIYHYFKNKDDIHYHLTNRGSELIQQFLIEHTNLDQKDPVERFVEIAKYSWDFAFENEELYTIMFQMKQKRLNKEAMISNRSKMIFFLKEILPNAPEQELNRVFQSYHCLIHGYISLFMNNRVLTGDRDECKQMMMEALRSYLNSLKK